MAVQYGNLLVYRQHLDLEAGTTAVVTGIQINTNNFSPDPGLPSRLMVVVLPPTSSWSSVVAMSEPYLDGTDLVVDFRCSAATSINVMFWLPHSLVGPVSVEPYGASCASITNIAEICSVTTGGS